MTVMIKLKWQILIVTICFVVSTPTMAEKISLKRVDLDLKVPTGWFIKEGLLDIPLVLVSETVNEQRASISFTPSQHKDFEKMDLSDFQNQFPSYQSSRNAYVNKRSGKVIEFKSPRFVKTSNLEYGIVGVEYSMSDRTFEEYSIQIFCEGRHIFSKLLFERNSHPNALALASDVLKTLKCEEWKE